MPSCPVTIQEGTLVALSEEQFVEAVRHTARELMHANQEMVLRLRHECFPPPERLPVW